MLGILPELPPDRKQEIIRRYAARGPHGRLIRAVAREINVSPSLVSRVLKGTGTSERVARALNSHLRRLIAEEA